MKAHLKTIGTLISLVLILAIGINFPAVTIVFASLVFLLTIYLIIYQFFDNGDDNSEDELSGPFNAGGRERD